jgi:hypothetical protein
MICFTHHRKDINALLKNIISLACTQKTQKGIVHTLGYQQSIYDGEYHNGKVTTIDDVLPRGFLFCPNEDFHTLTSRGWSNSATVLINTDSPFHLISHGKFMMICYEVVISKGIKPHKILLNYKLV